MNRSLPLSLAMAIFAASALSGCAATRTSESTGEYVDNSALTVKVKAALLEDEGLKSFKIGVESFKDSVQLSGFVDSDDMKTKAGSVAAGVAGVRSVKNDLVVK